MQPNLFPNRPGIGLPLIPVNATFWSWVYCYAVGSMISTLSLFANLNYFLCKGRDN